MTSSTSDKEISPCINKACCDDKLLQPIINRSCDSCSELIIKGSFSFLSAVRTGDVKTVAVQSSDKKHLLSKDKAGRTCLHIAASWKRNDILAVLLRHAPLALVKTQDSQGRSCLFVAAATDNVEACKMLLAKAPHLLNVPDKAGFTPLLAACYHGCTEAARWLLDKDADALCCLRMYRTRLLAAASSGCVELFQQMRERLLDDHDEDVGLDVSCLFVAAKMGHMHLCAHLIQSEWFKTFPGEINGVDQTWKASALHAAASAGHLKVVKRLVLDWGADTEILDEDGNTPLECASSAEVKLFLAAAADPVAKVVIAYNRFKTLARPFLAFDWKAYNRTPTATELEQQFGASVDCGGRQKAYRATIRDLLKSDGKDKDVHAKIAAESKSQQAYCAKWLQACKSNLDRVLRIRDLREQQHRSLIDVEECREDIHSVNLSGLAGSSSLDLEETKSSIDHTIGGSMGFGSSSDGFVACSPAEETKSSVLGKRTQHPDEEPEGQSDTKRPRRSAPTSTAASSMDLSADEVPAHHQDKDQQNQQDQQVISRSATEQNNLQLKPVSADDETDDNEDNEGKESDGGEDVTLKDGDRVCRLARLLDGDMQELQRICSASSQQILQVSRKLDLTIARDQMLSKCARRLRTATNNFHQVTDHISNFWWMPHDEHKSLSTLSRRLNSSVQECQSFLDAHQKVGPLLDCAVKQLAVEQDCQRALQLAQTHCRFADEDTETTAGKEKPLATALAAAQKQLGSLKQQLYALIFIAPELLAFTADPRFSKLGLGADSPLALLTVERAFSDDYQSHRKRDPPLGTIWSAVEIATGQVVVLKEYSEDQLHLLNDEVATMSQLRSPFVLAPQLVFFDVDTKKSYLQLTHPCDRLLVDWIAESKTAVYCLSEVILLIRKLVLGLQAMHEAGVVQRNVTPWNVVLDKSSGDPLWANCFDCSSLTESKAYTAPEVAAGGHPSRQSDLFSLGQLLSALCAAFVRSQTNKTFGSPEVVPVSLDNFIQALRSPQPSKRPHLASVLSLPLFAISTTVSVASKDRLLRVTLQVQQQLDSDHKQLISLPVVIDRRPECKRSVVDQVIDCLDIEDILRPLDVTFMGEVGEDDGGLTSELFRLFFTEILQNPSLFEVTNAEPVTRMPIQVPARNELNRTQKRAFYTFGRLLFKLAHDRCLVSALASLPLCFFRWLLVPEETKLGGFELTPTDHQQVMGTQPAAILQRLALLDSKELALYQLDFSELKPDGHKVQVDSSNLYKYMRLQLLHEIALSRHDPLVLIWRGFHDHDCTKTWTLLEQLHPDELRLLFAGSPKLDRTALAESLTFQGFSKTSHVPSWFQELVQAELSDQDVRTLLKMVTTNDFMPPILPRPFITITRTGDTTRLPVARTCFRSIDFPDYASKVQLSKKLRLFLDSARDEFGVV